MAGNMKALLAAARAKDEPEQEKPAQPIPREIQLAAAAQVLTEGKPAKGSEKTPAIRGKSSNPDYEAVKVWVLSDYRKRATRKWEDEGGQDFADLIERLLSKYLGA